MQVYKGIDTFDRPLSRVIMTIGNFDGVHLGHQKIFKLVKEKAKNKNGSSVVYTFRPHPREALKPIQDGASSLQLLTTYDEKIEQISKLEIDVLIEEPFNREFSVISPKDFFNHVVLSKLSAEEIVVGYDFAFGKERQGTLEALGEFCKKSGVELTVVPPLRIDHEVVSSSRIRQHLLSGEIEKANLLLGRKFSYSGVVIRGDGRGRKIGFPTANLKLDKKLTLPFGVYATQIKCKIPTGKGFEEFEEKEFKSITNIGIRPTFLPLSQEQVLFALVETHILDASIDLYGVSIEVCFLKKIRDEKKFPSVNDLTQQIQKDIKTVHELFLTSSY